MAEQIVSFYSDGISFSLENPSDTSAWIIACLENEGLKCAELNVVFTTDDRLIRINTTYLNHDTYTDVITFDYSESDFVSGEIYISLERVRENAVSLGLSESDELLRVIIHGVLHLCGYSDKKPKEKVEMTRKEDYYLSLRTF